MSVPPEQRISELEARIAELERRPTPMRWRPGPGLLKRLALVALAMALTIPAGVLASHRFNDVPTSNQFHNAISAIADAGITTGCPQGTNNFCPNGLVTRGQMAAFLSRLGALQPGSAPKVNADKLDGYNAADLTRVASFNTADTLNLPLDSSRPVYASLDITAPAPGFVSVNFGFTIRNASCTANCAVFGLISHAQTEAATTFSVVNATMAMVYGSGSLHYVFPVAAGTNTFELRLTRASIGDGVMQGWYGTGNAMYTPFGSAGGSTLGTADASATSDSVKALDR